MRRTKSIMTTLGEIVAFTTTREARTHRTHNVNSIGGIFVVDGNREGVQTAVARTEARGYSLL